MGCDTYGAPTVSIAIVDSGIDLTHIDLAGNLWLNPGEIAGNGLDDDSNGFIDDTRGWNFVSGNNDVADENGHGTLVSGVVAAIGGNGEGVVGVCPQCRIMPVKVMSAAGTANYSDVAVGVLYAAEKGAKVINISLGGYSNSNTLLNAINTVTNTYGAVVVAGAGNDNSSTPFYPAAYNNVLAVAGTASDDTKVNTSNYGTWVDVSAPGVDIRTTALGGGWADQSGTSFSAPFVAGVAGLLRTLHPTWNQATIRSQIIHTADEIDSLNLPSHSGLLGSGRLNAGLAMQTPHLILSMTEYAVNGQTNGRPLLGATAQMNVTLHNDWWNATGVTATLTTTDTLNVTVVNGTASYGNIPAATDSTNSTPFTFSVASGAEYNHPIPFKLHVTDTAGYSTDINFTVTTESGVEEKYGTIALDDTWTNDKTYLITANVGVAPGVTLTIQPGTTIKFDGNFVLNVGGTLIADGTSDQPIVFRSNSIGNWDKIQFADSSTDAVADGSGQYVSGSILRYVNMEGAGAGIACTKSTPFLSHVLLKNGELYCYLGETDLWLLDSAIAGDVTIPVDYTYRKTNAYRNTIGGNIFIIYGTGIAEDNTVHGYLSIVNGGDARRNTVGSLYVGGNGGIVDSNVVNGLAADPPDVGVGNSFTVTGNTIGGRLRTGTDTVVDHNVISNGVSVGSSSTVTWNSIEGSSDIGLEAGSDVTAQYNRLIGNTTGMTASTGLIEHNLIANNTGVGLQVGAATVQYNTFTGNRGNTIVIQGETPVAITYNNLEGNRGTYDLYVNIASGVSAQNNWWGTMDELAIPNRIFDINEDYTKGAATFSPILSSPDQSAPGYARGMIVLPDSTLGIQTGTFQVQFSRPMDNTHLPNLEFYRPEYKQVSVSVDGSHTCGLKSNGGIACWGFNGYGQANAPMGIFTQVSAGGDHTCGVKNDGGITCWGNNDHGQTNAPAGTFTQVSAGQGHTCGLKDDGGIACWGWNNDGQANAPAGIYTQVSAGWGHTCGVKNDGGIACWGKNAYGQANAPAGIFTQVSAGASYTCGLKNDGGIACWGFNDNGQADAPAGIYTQVSAGGGHTCDLKNDGNIACWGWNNYGQTNAPAGIFTQISAGWRYSCGLKNNGSIACWGYDGFGQATVPASSNPHYPIVDNANWLSSNTYQATFDVTSAIAKDSYRFVLSNAIDADGMIALSSETTFMVDYAGSITDQTPPVKPVVTARGDTTLSVISANWTTSDPESPIIKYRYAIGTTPGGRDVVDWTYNDKPYMTHAGLTLTAGVNYYVSAAACNEGGLWSLTGVSNPVPAGVLPSIKTIRSAGAYDGWILESTETSNKGGAMNSSTTTFNLGDNNVRKQYRTVLSFNTTLPSNAYIIKATLKIRKQAQVGSNPFTTLGNILVDIRKSAFSNNNALQIGDFQAVASKNNVGAIRNNPVSNWYSANLLNTSFVFINKAGVTQLRLRFTNDDNNNSVADYLKFFSGNYATTSARPTLIIEYYVP